MERKKKKILRDDVHDDNQKGGGTSPGGTDGYSNEEREKDKGTCKEETEENVSGGLVDFKNKWGLNKNKIIK